ncbi:MAG TPA: sigma-70 family RNA polymerase sigma factor [Gemmatimonadota bacterium]|nr:sigma-70 family RNA polymerase sigma factor [Gemmatimonadota bacterium]
MHDRRGEFEAIYREHHRRVYAIALRFAREPDIAEEIVQDAFVRAWRSLPSFNGNSRLSTWLHSVAVNAALDRVRTRQRAEGRIDRDVDLDRYAGEIGRAMPAADVDLERAVAALPDGAREVVILHYFEGYPCAEIAGRLGVVEGTVKSQLHRARQLLKEALA